MNPTPTIEGRSVTPRYHGSKTFGSQQRGALGNNGGERQRAPRFFAYFLAILARLRHETSYFHASALRSRWTKHEKFLFSFSKLRYGPVQFNPENFANIWQIKWNWIRSMKFDTLPIYFLSDFSVCCHPKIFLQWQRDVTTSPLYSPENKENE